MKKYFLFDTLQEFFIISIGQSGMCPEVCRDVAGMGEFMKEYVRTVNYYETDQMGIVHHSNYIRYFEEARLFWMEEIGICYHELEEMGIIIPVTFVDCRYASPLHYGDCVRIVVRMAKFDGIKMEFEYQVIDSQTGEIHTTGRSGHCFLDSKMKPILIKKKQPEVYRRVVEALQEDGGIGRKGM